VVLPAVQRLTTRGLITLERARMLTGRIGRIRLPEHLHEATKLTVYVGRKERIGGRPAYQAVVELLQRHAVAGATVLLGVDGTVHGVRQRARFFGGNVDVPLMIIAVGAGEAIATAAGELATLLTRPLTTLERVRVCKRAGATALRGIWGYHGDHAPHGDTFWSLRRHVPVLTVIVDTPERIRRAFAIVDELTDETGLVTSELVPAYRAAAPDRVSGGLRLA